MVEGWSNNRTRGIKKMSRTKYCVFVALITFSGTIWGVTKLAFVTSETGNGKLSTWASSSGQDGTAGADTVCRTVATNAGIADPNSFVAWLSDSDDDAYCRANGFTGTRANNCGQASLPATSGPWQLTGNVPFADSIGNMVAPVYAVLRPANRDEFGALLPTSTRWFTGTTGSGAHHTSRSDCTDWSDETTTQNTGIGGASATASGLSTVGSSTCTSNRALFCLQVGVGDPLPPEDAEGRLAFVSTETGTGNLSSWASANGVMGIAAGDEICQSEAQQAGFGQPETFKAWLSGTALNAVDRFVHTSLAVVRPDGVKISDSLPDLASSMMESALNVDSAGGYHQNELVWTGTLDGGITSPDHCGDWASELSSGRTGAAYRTEAGWTQAFTTQCNFASARLYCISDTNRLERIFADGFEN